MGARYLSTRAVSISNELTHREFVAALINIAYCVGALTCFALIGVLLAWRG